MNPLTACRPPAPARRCQKRWAGQDMPASPSRHIGRTAGQLDHSFLVLRKLLDQTTPQPVGYPGRKDARWFQALRPANRSLQVARRWLLSGRLRRIGTTLQGNHRIRLPLLHSKDAPNHAHHSENGPTCPFRERVSSHAQLTADASFFPGNSVTDQNISSKLRLILIKKSIPKSEKVIL